MTKHIEATVTVDGMEYASAMANSKKAVVDHVIQYVHQGLEDCIISVEINFNEVRP